MKLTLPPEIEQSRVEGFPFGRSGLFLPLCPVMARRLKILVSDGADWGRTIHRRDVVPDAQYAKMKPEHRAYVDNLFRDGPLIYPPPAWEHVSVSSQFGTPTWAEMAWVKDQFWEPTECVVQFHVPAADHINLHSNVLHLWRVVGVEFPLPPKSCV